MNNKDMPAMPQPIASNGVDFIDAREYDPCNGGLTKREHFAGLAMQGLLAGGYCMDDPQNRLSNVPSEAMALADALLAELDKTSK
jgi:hypothetical protein